MTSYGDIRLYFHPNETGDFADVWIEDGDFVRDEGLFTAVLISLFSDARVSDKDLATAKMGKNPRGFWADDTLGFNLGSRLWLLGRSKLVNKTFRLAEQYSDAALQWLIDEAVITSVTTTASKTEDNRLLLAIELKGPGDELLETFRFKMEWLATLNER